MTTLPRPVRTCLVAVVAGVTLLTGGTIASADTRPSSAGTQDALTGQYSSMSTALLDLYARQSSQTIGDYLVSQQLLLSTATLEQAPEQSPSPAPSEMPTSAPTVSSSPEASAAPQAPTLPATPALGTSSTLGQDAGQAAPVTASTVAELDAALKGAGLALDTSGFKDLNSLARGVAAKSNTIDGAVTIAGAQWMTKLGQLRTPALGTPKAQSAQMPGLPKSALAFGLFADKSLTRAMSSSPELFAQVQRSGVGSSALAKSWQQSMAQTWAASGKDFSKVLPDPCTGGMLSVMATGNPHSASKSGARGCSTACITGGLYLNSQTTSLFSSGVASSQGNPYSSMWNTTTLNGLQPWQQKQLLAQNPSLAKSILNPDGGGASSAACSASSTASSSALTSTLPGVFKNLRTK